MQDWAFPEVTAALEEEAEVGPSQKAPGCRREEAGSGRRHWILEEAESEGVAERRHQMVPRWGHARAAEKEQWRAQE